MQNPVRIRSHEYSCSGVSDHKPHRWITASDIEKQLEEAKKLKERSVPFTKGGCYPHEFHNIEQLDLEAPGPGPWLELPVFNSAQLGKTPRFDEAGVVRVVYTSDMERRPSRDLYDVVYHDPNKKEIVYVDGTEKVKELFTAAVLGLAAIFWASVSSFRALGSVEAIAKCWGVTEN
ncbi:hypothetical protein N658DRAFT_487922 [Parathielavia hyrcaniae]|uniref:Uncharacterized protein n=1 Tax=Parathielavia hyrcaniae TaxID=113614 RepID=A0AAN6PWA7_9PEZI|nr:hypothetical protein N658DRAFT_487922 [Parathielavia hyrcaniae]